MIEVIYETDSERCAGDYGYGVVSVCYRDADLLVQFTRTDSPWCSGVKDTGSGSQAIMCGCTQLEFERIWDAVHDRSDLLQSGS